MLDASIQGAPPPLCDKGAAPNMGGLDCAMHRGAPPTLGAVPSCCTLDSVINVPTLDSAINATAPLAIVIRGAPPTLGAVFIFQQHFAAPPVLLGFTILLGLKLRKNKGAGRCGALDI